MKVTKKNQVVIINDPITHTQTFVDAKDLILDTSAKEENQKKLGTVLNQHSSAIQNLKEENAELKKTVLKLVDIVNQVNLKK